MTQKSEARVCVSSGTVGGGGREEEVEQFNGKSAHREKSSYNQITHSQKTSPPTLASAPPPDPQILQKDSAKLLSVQSRNLKRFARISNVFLPHRLRVIYLCRFALLPF